MDKFDREILNILQKDARITNQELSERVNLSPSPCLRRVRALEKSGIISGYTTIIDQRKIGFELSLFIRVKIERHSNDTVELFEDGIKVLDNVISCYLMSGTYDYLLHVVAQNLQDYEVFLRDKLHKLPGISEIDSGFAFGCVKPPSSLYI